MNKMRNRPKMRRANARSKKRPRKKLTPRKHLSSWIGILGYFPVYVGLFLLASGGVYLPSSLYAQRADVELHQNGISTIGDVIEIKRSSTPHSRPGGGSTTYFPVTEQDVGSRRLTNKWTNYQTTNPDFWVQGTQLPVLYDPAKPKRMAIDTAEASRLVTRNAESNQRQMLVGAPMALAGFALIYVGKRIDPDPRKKRKRAKGKPRNAVQILGTSGSSRRR